MKNKIMYALQDENNNFCFLYTGTIKFKKFEWRKSGTKQTLEEIKELKEKFEYKMKNDKYFLDEYGYIDNKIRKLKIIKITFEEI